VIRRGVIADISLPVSGGNQIPGSDIRLTAS
jgi:hypothetical protein